MSSLPPSGVWCLTTVLTQTSDTFANLHVVKNGSNHNRACRLEESSLTRKDALVLELQGSVMLLTVTDILVSTFFVSHCL